MSKSLVVKIKSNKLAANPLFIKFLNWTRDKHTIDLMLLGIQESFESEQDKKIVKNVTVDEEFLKALENFRERFVRYMANTLANKNVSEEFLVWLSNAYKYLQEDIENYHNNETRKIRITDAKGRWFESIICYNFINTFNNFGLEIIKCCPICSKFFCHKGKYAKYCGEDCKGRGMKK